MREEKYNDTMIEEGLKPFAIILVLVGCIYFVPMLIPFNELPFEGRLWIFREDMNGDGRVTIRDIWALGSWLFFYPGDLLIYFVYHHMPQVAADLRSFADFFEVQPLWYGGLFSFILSIVGWPIACLLIYLSYSALLSSGRIYWYLLKRIRK